MVQLTEVPDAHFEEQAVKATLDNDDDDFTDTDSEISTDSDYNPHHETLADRIYALRGIIPPTTRAYVSDKVSTCHSAVASVLSFSGKTLWVVTTSALLFAVPFALATTEDQQIAAMEQESKMREMGGDLMMGNPDGAGDTASQVSAALATPPEEGKPAL